MGPGIEMNVASKGSGEDQSGQAVRPAAKFPWKVEIEDGCGLVSYYESC